MTVVYLHLNLKEISRPNLSLIKEALKFAISHHARNSLLEFNLQTLLGHVNVTQVKEAYKTNVPLFDCNVVFEDVCGYLIHLEPSVTHICFPENDSVKVDQWNKERTKTGLNELNKQLLEFIDPPIQLSSPIQKTEPRVFERVAVGGTFDHLHAGHKILLTMTALLSEKSMVVGVTDDCMLTKKKHKDLIGSTTDRIKKVEAYLHSVKRSIQYNVVPITDPFGPTVTDPTIDALVVSKETLKGGDLVNSERGIRGYPALELRIIDVISTDSHSIKEQDMAVLKISSSWIREYIASKTQ
ncbi:unnamed protein product [Rhizopus stolonifer]